MSRHRLLRLATLAALSLGTVLNASALALPHAHEDDSVDICGHKDHDGLELRAQAATRSYWQDAHAADPDSWVRFKILGFNDFHGHLEPRYLSFAHRYAGGAAVLGSYLEAASARSENGAIIVHAGDQVGASPPISALLQDEPSIMFLNMLTNKYCKGDDDDDHHHHHKGRHETRDEDPRFNPRCNLVGTVGNHEFDEGVGEMLRLINGGNHPNGPFLEPEYEGARFPYVVANVVYADSGKPVLPPYVIKRIHGQPIAFIGAVLKETPTIVTPTGVAGVRFLDEAEAINSYVPELKRKGVRAIVVTIHQGTSQASYSGPTGTDPVDVGGDIGPIISNLDDEIDIVVAGHWHQFTNALMPNKHGKLILVTQAFSYSTAYADIDVAIDPASKDIVYKSAKIVTPWVDQGPGLTPDPAIASMVSAAAQKVEPLVNRVIGTAAADILRAENSAGESALGNLIADAQRSAMGTDVAFMNPGGIRADLFAGEITWGELFTIQPFNNDLVRMDLSGQQIVTLLEQQWLGQTSQRILKTAGIQYQWNPAAAVGSRVVTGSILINGNPIDLAASYSVTVNSFLAAGGDNFTVLTQGTNRVIGPVDLDALVTYIGALPQPISAAIEGRIQLAP
jgi:5'-nucleotidase